MGRQSIRLTRVRSLILFSIGTLGMISLFCFTIYFPQKERIAELKISVEGERNQLLHIENFLNQHPDLGAYEREIDGRMKFVNDKLPDETKLGEFVADVERAAGESGVTLMQIKAGQGDVIENYRRTPLSIELNGEYMQLLNFLKRLADLSRFHTINKMELQKTKDVLHVKLLLIIYTFGAPQEVNKEGK